MNPNSPANLIVQWLDLTGMIAFAVSGAVVGARRGMDIFGIIVLAFLTAVAGGIGRDVLIGCVPPGALQSWHGLAVAVVVGVLVFGFGPLLIRLRPLVRFLDAVGLAVFAVTGAEKALDWGLSPAMAAVLGMLSAVGGGVIRDMLAAQVPVVLTSEIYAIAALLGAAVVVIGAAVKLPLTAVMLAGAMLCLLLRLVAMHRDWRLPNVATTAMEQA
jgi:uncharacterized membrane protein YeiH